MGVFVGVDSAGDANLEICHGGHCHPFVEWWMARTADRTDRPVTRLLARASIRSHSTTGCAGGVPLTGPTDRVKDQPEHPEGQAIGESDPVSGTPPTTRAHARPNILTGGQRRSDPQGDRRPHRNALAEHDAPPSAVADGDGALTPMQGVDQVLLTICGRPIRRSAPWNRPWSRSPSRAGRRCISVCTGRSRWAATVTVCF